MSAILSLRFLPGQIVYWPRSGSMLIAQVAHVYCHEPIEPSEWHGGTKAMNLYTLTNSAGCIPESELYGNWGDALAAMARA